MCTSETLYMGELQRCVDEVTRGAAGSILNNPELVHDYDSDMLEILWHAVEAGNDDVRAELILLLAKLNVGSVYGDVEAMAEGSSPTVRAACEAYIHSVRGSGNIDDYLREALESSEEPEFKDAVCRLLPLVREDDVPKYRRNQRVSHESDVRDVEVLLRMIMVRNPHLYIDDNM